MNRQNKPTVAARVLPIAGRQLPEDFNQTTQNYGGNWDRRDLKNMWRTALNDKPAIDSPTRNARLQPPSWEEIYGKK